MLKLKKVEELNFNTKLYLNTNQMRLVINYSILRNIKKSII